MKRGGWIRYLQKHDYSLASVALVWALAEAHIGEDAVKRLTDRVFAEFERGQNNHIHD